GRRAGAAGWTRGPVPARAASLASPPPVAVGPAVRRLDLDEVGDLVDHPEDLGAVLVHHRRANARQPERPERPALVRLVRGGAAYLGDSHVGHRSIMTWNWRLVEPGPRRRGQ